MKNNKYVEKRTFGPGPAAYDPLTALKTICTRQKPQFQYYAADSGFHSSVLRQTVAAESVRAKKYG